MNDEELDKIASAALDGEATEAEMERFGADADFAVAQNELGRAHQLFSGQALPQPPEGLASRQISFAIREFEALVDQRAVHAKKSARSVTQTRRQVGLPRWLAPAFFSIAVLAGIGFAAANIGGGGADSDETAGDSLTVAESTATTTTADARLAADAAEVNAAQSGDDVASDGGFASTPAPIDTSETNFSASRSMSPEQIDELTKGNQDPIDPAEYTRCATDQRAGTANGELLRVFAFFYDGQPAELLVYSGAEDQVVTLIVDDDCMVLAES